MYDHELSLNERPCLMYFEQSQETCAFPFDLSLVMEDMEGQGFCTEEQQHTSKLEAAEDR